MSKAIGNILVVDDILENLQILTQMLTRRNYKVRPAVNGKLALKAVQLTLPDLILLDIQMPDMDGYEVCEKLKADEKTHHIPIIFISALDEVFDKVKAFSVGGVDYITKPFQAEEVLMRVETHFKMHKMQRQLVEKNDELQVTLAHLKTTQKQLVEAEKMASLGCLVAGVAHEINTPIGIGVTAASTLADRSVETATTYDNQQLKGSALKAHFDNTIRGSNLILKNLERAAELIQTFKQVAVNQNNLNKRSFIVTKYIESALSSLEPHLKITPHEVTVNGDEQIEINSYPDAFSQIVVNLVMNSLRHAYPKEEAGHLDFEVKRDSEHLTIEYSDDGCGIPAKNVDKIFEPFFTTARPQGNIGLGLHIIYNLVTHKLQGIIRVQSKIDSGTRFIIELPIHSLEV
jgi:signal transduction histidine kinase